MDKTIKSKWVKALRSGKYRQARKTLLTRHGGMCCLGVLAKIQGCDLTAQKKNGFSLISSDLPRGFNAGIKQNVRRKLASMNDSLSSSFNKIADYIENRL